MYCFWMFVNKLFTYSRTHIISSKRYFYVKFSTYFHVKTKILADFQICISVPLIFRVETPSPTQIALFLLNKRITVKTMCFLLKDCTFLTRLATFRHYFIPQSCNNLLENFEKRNRWVKLLSEQLRCTRYPLTHYSPVLLIYTPWKHHKI